MRHLQEEDGHANTCTQGRPRRARCHRGVRTLHARTHALTHPYTKVTGLQIDGPIDEVVRTSKRQSTRACSSQRLARIASGPAGFSQWNDELGEWEEDPDARPPTHEVHRVEKKNVVDEPESDEDDDDEGPPPLISLCEYATNHRRGPPPARAPLTVAHSCGRVALS